MWFPSAFLVVLFVLTASANQDLVLDDSSQTFQTSNIRASLYTRSNPTEAVELQFEDGGESMDNSELNSEHPTKIIITSNDGKEEHELRDAYLSRGDFNIIEVKWEASAAKSSDTIDEVARTIHRLLKSLKKIKGISSEIVSLIGYGVGAIVAGEVGRLSHGTSGSNLGSIVGLDPHLHSNNTEDNMSLSEDDALYVLIIKTSGLKSNEYTGHAEIYLNNADVQPGCEMDNDPDCSRRRSISFFAHSIASKLDFIGKGCKIRNLIADKVCVWNGECAKVRGEPLDTNILGAFYVETGSAPPFFMPNECTHTIDRYYKSGDDSLFETM